MAADALGAAVVYVIRCVPSGLVYVGSTLNVRVRFRAHRFHLARGTHHNAALQRAWQEYGAAAFDFSVVEVVDRVELLGVAEEQWIVRLDADDPAHGFNYGRRVGRLDVRTDRERTSPVTSKPPAPSTNPAPVALVDIQPVTRRALHQQVAESLRELIVVGKVRQGDTLPPERELAERFGVSRATVREALRVLPLWGLVEARQGGGNYVSLPSLEHIVAPLVSVIEHTRAPQDELLDARFDFEPGVCWLAAQRRTAADLAAIEAIIARQTERVEQGELAVEEDSAFHLALAEATHNRVIPRLIQTINDLLLESRLRSLRTPDRPRRSLEGHLRILAALRASDAEAARQAMRDHITEIAASLRAAGVLPA
ncbi:MAG TPA: FCD domain-containing protein [Ktedonobacterales bacterium]